MPHLPRLLLVGDSGQEPPAADITDVHLSGAEDGHLLRTGCDLVLAKPCAPHVLSRVVAGMIQRRREAGAVTT